MGTSPLAQFKPAHFALWLASTARSVLIRRTGLSVVAGLYVCIIGFAIAQLYLHGGTVKDAGWTWQTSPAGVLVATVNANGPAAVLTPGSRILAINNDQRAAQAGPRPWLQRVQAGQSYSVQWLTPAGIRSESTFSMSVRKSELDLEMGVADLLLSLSYAIAGLFVWALKPNDLVGRTCYVACLLMAFYLVASAIGPVSPQMTGLALVCYILIRSLFPLQMIAGSTFFARFPAGTVTKSVWRYSLIALWVAGFAIWFLTVRDRVFPFLGLEWRLPILSGLDLDTRPELDKVMWRHGYIALCGVFVIGVTIYNHRHLATEAMRLRVRWVMVGSAAGIIPGVLCSLGLALLDAAHLHSPVSVRSLIAVYSLSTLSLIAIPIAVAYAVLCNQLMGVRVAVSSGFQFLATRRVFPILSLIPVIPIVLYLWTHRDQRVAELFSRPIAAVPLVLSVLVLVFRRELLEYCERFLFRLRHSRDADVQNLLETLLDQHSAEGIARVTASRLREVFGVERLVLFCAESDVPVLPRGYVSPHISVPFILPRDGELAKVLSEKGTAFLNSKLLSRLPESERRWISDGKFVLAVPAAGELKSELAGVILLGEKVSGERYTATDLDLLDDAARQVYLGLRMRELEKSRDRAVQEYHQSEESGRTRTQFFAQVSHQLRNPLRGVVGLTDLLLDTPLRDDQKEYTELIRRSSEWIAAIAKDDLPSGDSGRLRLDRVEFEWIPLLEDLTAIAAERARDRDIEVVLQVDADTPLTTTGDPIRVRQVLLNLLDNAIKFTDHGWVLISARRQKYGPGMSSILVMVEDTGPGIPEPVRTRFFGAGTAPATGAPPAGSGLGLAISKRLTDEMRGQLTFEDRAGGGTRFLFTLAAGTATLPSSIAAQPLKGLNLLCIDPLSTSRLALCSTLSSLGVQTTAVASETDPAILGRYDAVLLAARSTAESLTAIGNIRQARPLVPIIILHRVGLGLPGRDLSAIGRVEQLHRPASRRSLLRALERAVALHVEA